MTHPKSTRLDAPSRPSETPRRIAVADPWDLPCTEPIVFGSRLTPEERAWQVTVLLPAFLEALRRAADDANAAIGRDADGQPIP